MLYRELGAYRAADVMRSVRAIDAAEIALAVGLAGVCSALGALVEIIALRYAGRRVPYPRGALASFVGQATSSALGYPLLTGVPARYRYYSASGVSVIDIAKVVAFCNLTFWVGYVAVAGVALLVAPSAAPVEMHVPILSPRFIGALALVSLAAYIGTSGALGARFRPRVRGVDLPFPSARQSAAQVALSALDIIASSAALFALLPEEAGVSFVKFLALYVIALVPGILSQVPGGLDVFDAALMLFLSGRLSAAALAGPLLAYRAIFVVLPLAVAALLVAIHEVRARGN